MRWLTWEEVCAIRSSRETTAALAKRYGVTEDVIRACKGYPL